MNKVCHRSIPSGKPIECFKKKCELWDSATSTCSDTTLVKTIEKIASNLSDLSAIFDGIGQVAGDVSTTFEQYSKKRK